MKTSSGNLFLVGMMGAGKTTVGRLLAQRLGKTFVDADHEIEARCGVRIPVIFDIEGEAGFRRREASVIEDLSQRHDQVIATGGGAIGDAGTRALLRTNGVTIYLAAVLNDLWQRTRNDRNRPMLQGGDVRGRIAALLSVREPLYREVADLVIETGRPSANRLVPTIVDALAHHPDFGHAFVHYLSADDSGVDTADATNQAQPHD